MSAPPLTNLERLSLNQITTEQWSLEETIGGCLRAGIPWIAPWRHKAQEVGIDKAARMVREAGLRVSSYCRGGFFPARSGELPERLDDNRRAVDEAFELGANLLVLVCGAAPDKDIGGARRMVEDGLGRLLDHARAAGVRLGIEPLHPMFAADRSVVVTLGQAKELASRFPAADVGVVVDVYHVWWDPHLYEEIDGCRGRILGFHVSDWIVPTPELLAGRGMMGDGVIELRKIRAAVEAAGYEGPIEVEVLNRELWSGIGDEVVDALVRGYLEHV